MAEHAQQNGPLSAAVADVASGVALALRGEGGSYALSGLLAADEAVALAAVRVLGADVLAPYALDTRAAVATDSRPSGGASARTDPRPYGGPPTHGQPGGGDRPGAYDRADPYRHPGPPDGPGSHRGSDGPGSQRGTDESVVRKALAAYPPKPGASEVSRWSYLGLAEASRVYLPGAGGGWPTPQAGADWVRDDPWPQLAHRASQLAALCLPDLAPELAEALAGRTDDLARGFVRAVRRRDWLQAAGLGRWLSRMPAVPGSLGLDSGLVFVRRMSGGDPRVALHLTAAHRFHGLGG